MASPSANLRDTLDSFTKILRDHGCEVTDPVVAPPADQSEIASVERALGITLPDTTRQAFRTIAASVDWSWSKEDSFPSPFDEIFAGDLHWSIVDLPQHEQRRKRWVVEVFPDRDNPYDAVWHDKLAFMTVANGDQLAVDLGKENAGSIVYLSHDDGEGHGFAMASSLTDLVDRWVPLACPGAEDWQWLPFVPLGEGPVDPTCATASEWTQLLGLPRPSTPLTPTQPDDEVIDSLLETYRNAPESSKGERAGLRALRLCTLERQEDVLALLTSENEFVQELAAKTLGKWQVLEAIPQLIEVALNGTHNGRIGAMVAIREMPGPEAEEAARSIRERGEPNRTIYLGTRGR